MAGARDIRAGGAYVEISARDGAFMRGLSRAQGQLRAFASSCQSIGSSLLAVSGAALAPLGIAASAFAGFDDAMRSVAAVTGATGEQFDALTARARALGAATRYTAQEAAGAMLALGRAGMDTRQIDASVQSVLALATATGTDLAQSAEVVSNTLNMFGMGADRASDAADLLTATANGSAQTLTDLFESLRMVGPQAKAAGYSLEETSAALGVLANVGLKGSMAGNALKRALQQFADPATQQKLAEIGVTVKDDAGELRALPEIFRDLADKMNKLPGAEKLALAKDIFDVRASGAGLNLAANVDALDRFLASLREVDGAATKTEAQMNAGIGGALAALKSAAQDVALSVGNALAPSLQKLADEWRGNLNGISEWVAAHKNALVIVAKVAAGMAALGAAFFVVGKAIGVVNAVLAITKAAWVFFTGIPALVTKVYAFAVGLKGLAGAMWYARDASIGLAAPLAIIAGSAVGAFLAMRALSGETYREQDAAKKALESEKARAAADNDKLERLQELATKERRSASEMEEADAIARQLNATYGAQIATVDRLTGAINVAADAQDRLAEKQRKAMLERKRAALAELQTNFRNLSKYSGSNREGWDNAWSWVSSGFDSSVFVDRMAEDSAKLRSMLAEMNELRAEIEAAEAAAKGSATSAVGAAATRGAGSRLAETEEVKRAIDDLERMDEELRRDGLSSLGRQIDDIEKARDKYVEAAQAVLNFENAQAEAFRDYEWIAELQEKIAARQLAAEKAIAEAREKAARAGTDALDRLAEAQADYAAARERRDENRRLDDLSKTDGAGYLAEVSRLLAAAKTGAAGAAEAYRTAVESAMSDGEMTDDERRAVDALLDAYRAAEDAVDRFSERLARASETAKDASNPETSRMSSGGSFYAAAASAAGGYMVRLVDAQESTKDNTKRILDLIKDGALEMRYA